jgi:hypothetical protein
MIQGSGPAGGGLRCTCAQEAASCARVKKKISSESCDRRQVIRKCDAFSFGVELAFQLSLVLWLVRTLCRTISRPTGTDGGEPCQLGSRRARGRSSRQGGRHGITGFADRMPSPDARQMATSMYWYRRLRVPASQNIPKISALS